MESDVLTKTGGVISIGMESGFLLMKTGGVISIGMESGFLTSM